MPPEYRTVEELYVDHVGPNTTQGLRPLTAFKDLRHLHLEVVAGVDLSVLRELPLETLSVVEPTRVTRTGLLDRRPRTSVGSTASAPRGTEAVTARRVSEAAPHAALASDGGQMNTPPAPISFGDDGITAGAEAMAAREPPEPGWPALFWAAFTYSASGMTLLDRQRRIVEVNEAQLALSGHRREQLLLRPFVEFVRNGRRITQQRWQTLIARGAFAGRAELLHADGSVVRVHYAACAQATLDRVLVIELPARAPAADVDRGATSTLAAPPPLSARQVQILGLVALGHTGPEIAAQLQLSHHTVRAHIANAKAKLGARSHAQLVAVALGATHDRAPQAATPNPPTVSN